MTDVVCCLYNNKVLWKCLLEKWVHIFGTYKIKRNILKSINQFFN